MAKAKISPKERRQIEEEITMFFIRAPREYREGEKLVKDLGSTFSGYTVSKLSTIFIILQKVLGEVRAQHVSDTQINSFYPRWNNEYRSFQRTYPEMKVNVT